MTLLNFALVVLSGFSFTVLVLITDNSDCRDPMAHSSAF